jgi:hypothetical protein
MCILDSRNFLSSYVSRHDWRLHGTTCGRLEPFAGGMDWCIGIGARGREWSVFAPCLCGVLAQANVAMLAHTYSCGSERGSTARKHQASATCIRCIHIQHVVNMLLLHAYALDWLLWDRSGELLATCVYVVIFSLIDTHVAYEMRLCARIAICSQATWCLTC